MFSVKTDVIIDSCTQLESYAVVLQQLNMDLEGVIRNLGSLSSLEEQIDRLKRQKEVLEEEQRNLWQMAQGLDKAALYYIHCENRICNYAEEGVIRFERKEAGISRLQKIVPFLEEITFMDEGGESW